MIRGPWQRRVSSPGTPFPDMRGPEARRPSKLRCLVESNLRRLRARREQHWAQALADNLNRTARNNVPTS